MVGGLQPTAGFARIGVSTGKLGRGDRPVAAAAYAGQNERDGESGMPKPPGGVRRTARGLPRAGEPKSDGRQKQSMRQ